jgi:hypothetical protein
MPKEFITPIDIFRGPFSENVASNLRRTGPRLWSLRKLKRSNRASPENRLQCSTSFMFLYRVVGCRAGPPGLHTGCTLVAKVMRGAWHGCRLGADR